MKYNRLKEIENYILSNEIVTIDVLCDVFNVSKNTIRRDIKLLTEKGCISKIYGGVIANQDGGMLSFFEERIVKNIPEKKWIGRAAAAFVSSNDVIFIDSGTTTFQMLDYIKDVSNLTVVTNNLKALNSLLQTPNIRGICIGGQLNRKTSSFTSADSATVLRNYNITKCFMAATGVSINNGLTNSTMEEYEIKRTAIEKSSKIFLMADATKFDVSSLMTYCPLSEVDCVITDNQPSGDYIDFFRRHTIDLILANPGASTVILTSN